MLILAWNIIELKGQFILGLRKPSCCTVIHFRCEICLLWESLYGMYGFIIRMTDLKGDLTIDNTDAVAEVLVVGIVDAQGIPLVQRHTVFL